MAEIKGNLKSILRGSLGSGVATLLARFLGLFKVMLEARFLGGGALASSWNLAFMIPNLFRRLFGEGALSQALIPMFTHTEAQHGLSEARKLLAVVLSALTALLIIITVAVSLGGLAFGNFFAKSDYVKDAMNLLPLLMPYTVFICLVGVMTAVVNTRKVFFLASLNALILNIVLIAIMLGSRYIPMGSSKDILVYLSCGVIFSGVMQFLMLAWLLKKHDVFPIFQKGIRPAKSIFKELFTLTLPGVIGGGAMQVSFLIDRSIAAYVGEYAIPSLNYTERLVYLPIGIVAIALSSVLMANMSQAAANKRFEEVREDLALGLRYVWFGCAPLAIFMICYREPLIRLFFKYGEFTDENVRQTAWALLFYAIGIPAFCATKILIPAFHSRKKMLTPMIVSIICVVLNIPLSILLMCFLAQGGIALATVISAMCNNMLLLYLLKRENFAPEMKEVIFTIIRSTSFAAAAALPAFYYHKISEFCGNFTIKNIPDAVPLLICSLAFLLIYLILSLLVRAPELREIYLSFFSRLKKKKGI